MKKLLFKWTLLIFVSLCLFACEDDKEEGPATVIKLDPEECTIKIGETFTITVQIFPNATEQNVMWSSDNTVVATVENGIVTAVSTGEADITAKAGEATAHCKVKVVAEPVSGISLNKTDLTLYISNTDTLVATVIPENATDKTVSWASDNSKVATVENGIVTAIAAGNAVITATAGDFSATCSVKVNALAPKIGDYFYSDGSWSDGGLISIEADGLNAVWAETKPAPLADKTVIGIVFQTFPDRIAQTDQEAGYTHGYVMAVKTAHGEEKETTFWSQDWDFSCLKGAKLASTWYSNVNGYTETQTVKETYTDNIATMMPAFDLVLNHFPLEAPASTSGWFLPSTGQMWDMVANLCGSDVASVMKEWQTLSKDATFYCSEKVSYDVLARFNATMSKISAADKDELHTIGSDSYHNYGSMWTSTPYDAESACIMNIGQDGLVECMTEWYDGDCVARPILAF